MLAIDSHNVWIELDHNEKVTPEEFLKGIESFYTNSYIVLNLVSSNLGKTS